MLRIFLPALQVGPGLTGVGTYTLELIRGLSHQTLHGEEIVVGAPFPEWFDFLREVDGFRVEPLGLPRDDAWGRMLATHTTVPRLAAAVGADWLVGPNFIAPLWGRCHTAVMVHDLTFRRFPGTTTRAKRLYYQMLVRRSVRRARLVFVSTETVGRELVEYAPEAAGKIWRTPEGVSPTYLATGDRGERPDPPVERRDLLFVGTLEPRKNLARIVSAHGSVCRRRPEFPRLRIVGGRGWVDEGIHRAMRDHPRPERLVRTGYVTPDELRAAYDSALALVFPSMYEGFGLPVVEAMARGCPVLTSRGIATEEVAGDAAVLVDPAETGEIERGMEQLVDDRDLRRRLAERGRERARGFSWDLCAQRTLEGLRHATPGSAQGGR